VSRESVRIALTYAALHDLVEEQLQRHNRKLATKVVSPMLESYRPELDASPELDSREASTTNRLSVSYDGW
jgi:hypothetical protein